MKKRKSKCWRDNYLPPELTREVLARLPGKTLMKFRCVCKTWRSLIDSSDFISLHSELRNNRMNNAQLLAWEKRNNIGYILTLRRCDTFKKIRDLGRIPNFHSFHGCCKGLILYDHNLRLILRNPSIEKSLMLPVQPLNGLVIRYYLGFVPSSNDYKVLAIDHDGVAAIYSLNDDCWRFISDQVNVKDCGLLLLSCVFDARVVSCGEAMYWIDHETGFLYSFNFDVEQFSLVQLPDSVKESIVWFIFTFGDSLAIFSMSSENSCIWVMEKDGGEDCWRLWFSGEPNSKLNWATY